MSLTPPIIHFFEYDTREFANPSGYRHIANGSFAFNSVIASGCSSYTTRDLPISSGIASSGTLLFPGTKFDFSDNLDHLSSTPVAILVHLGSSGVAISNLKFHLREDTALVIPAQSVGLDPGFVQINVSGSWHPNCIMPSGAGMRLSKNRHPLYHNFYRQDGHFGLTGENDRNASQFVYANLILPKGFPLGTFGICGSGNLRFGMAFDYYFNSFELGVNAP